MHRNQTFPQIVDKGVFDLTHFVEIAQNVEDTFGKPKVGFNQRVFERKGNVFEFAKGVFA